jgi:hypothetical protein
MTWVWIIAGVTVLLTLLGVTRVLRRLAVAFALAAGVLLLFHMQTAPGEAMAALGVMAGGAGLAGPLRRMTIGALF